MTYTYIDVYDLRELNKILTVQKLAEAIDMKYWVLWRKMKKDDNFVLDSGRTKKLNDYLAKNNINFKARYGATNE